MGIQTAVKGGKPDGPDTRCPLGKGVHSHEGESPTFLLKPPQGSPDSDPSSIFSLCHRSFMELSREKVQMKTHWGGALEPLIASAQWPKGVLIDAKIHDALRAACEKTQRCSWECNAFVLRHVKVVKRCCNIILE